MEPTLLGRLDRLPAVIRLDDWITGGAQCLAHHIAHRNLIFAHEDGLPGACDSGRCVLFLFHFLLIGNRKVD